MTFVGHERLRNKCSGSEVDGRLDDGIGRATLEAAVAPSIDRDEAAQVMGASAVSAALTHK